MSARKPFVRLEGYEPVGGPRCYRIIRFHEHGSPRTVRSNVTLAEAQGHCSREDTHGTRGGSRWFDGYDYMRGCAPKVQP
jgi:hypothetical protein